MSKIYDIYPRYERIEVLVDRTDRLVARVRYNWEEYYLTSGYISYKDSSLKSSFEEEAAITAEMARYGIAPQIIAANVFETKYGTVAAIISQAYTHDCILLDRNNVEINALIDKMHNIGVIHTNLNTRNIVYNEATHQYAIVDFKDAYRTSTIYSLSNSSFRSLALRYRFDFYCNGSQDNKNYIRGNLIGVMKNRDYIYIR